MFYANFTNSSNPINGTDIYCEIKFNLTGSWSVPENMTFNDTSMLYEYNRSFSTSGNRDFNVLCNGSIVGYDIINTTDNFIITGPPANGTVCSVGCDYNNITGALKAINNTNKSITLNGEETFVIDDAYLFNISDAINDGVIIINNSDVILDCNGSTIIGNGSGTGIFSYNKTNITVMNCNIDRYLLGTNLTEISESKIQNLSLIHI